jgi:hypothetical protein
MGTPRAPIPFLLLAGGIDPFQVCHQSARLDGRKGLFGTRRAVGDLYYNTSILARTNSNFINENNDHKLHAPELQRLRAGGLCLRRLAGSRRKAGLCAPREMRGGTGAKIIAAWRKNLLTVPELTRARR